MPIKRVCNTFSRDHALSSCPNSSQVLNRADLHQEIVSRYIRYSQDYWAGVRVRQRAYLAEQQLSIFEPRPNSVYRSGKSDNYIILQGSAASQSQPVQAVAAVPKPQAMSQAQIKGCFSSMICH